MVPTLPELEVCQNNEDLVLEFDFWLDDEVTKDDLTFVPLAGAIRKDAVTVPMTVTVSNQNHVKAKILKGTMWSTVAPGVWSFDIRPDRPPSQDDQILIRGKLKVEQGATPP